MINKNLNSETTLKTRLQKNFSEKIVYQENHVFYARTRPLFVSFSAHWYRTLFRNTCVG